MCPRMLAVLETSQNFRPKIREKLFYWQKLGILGFFGLLPHLRFHHRSMPSFLLWIASPPWGEAWSLEQRDDAWMGWDGMGWNGMVGTFFSLLETWLLQKPVESKRFWHRGRVGRRCSHLRCAECGDPNCWRFNPKKNTLEHSIAKKHQHQ